LSPADARLTKGQRMVGREAAAALASIGTPAVAPLVRATKTTHSLQQTNAVLALSLIKGASASDTFLKILRTGTPEGRLAAALALGERKGAGAIGPLVEMVDKGPWREGATKALVLLGDPRAVPPLIRVLEQGSREGKPAAADTLGLMRDPSAFDPLVAALKNKDDELKIAACVALGDLTDPRALDPLQALITHKNEAVRTAAGTAMARIRRAQR